MKPMKFSLKMAVEYMSEGGELKSQTEVHFGVPWFLRVNREEDNLGVYLNCPREEDAESPWSIDTTFRIRMVSGMRRIIYEKDFSFTYCENTGYGTDEFMTWEDVNEESTSGRTAMVYCDVTIRNMTGIAQKRKRSFEEAEEHVTDVVLTVGEEKFHVSKATLAAHSSHFKSMFFGGFKETKMPKIELNEVDPDVFQIILEIIYGDFDIPAEKVESLLKLGDRFDMPLVMKRCEEFLLETDEIGKKEKLRLADTFTLKNLMKDCMDKMTNPRELKSFMPANLTDLSQSTLAAILEKNLLQC